MIHFLLFCAFISFCLWVGFFVLNIVLGSLFVGIGGLGALGVWIAKQFKDDNPADPNKKDWKDW